MAQSSRKKSSTPSVKEMLQELGEILRWFKEQRDVDIEKVKRGAALIKELKSRLGNIENEFEEVKKDAATR